MAFESPPSSKSQYCQILFSSKSRCKHIWNSIPVWSERIVLESIFEMSDICQFLCLYVFHRSQSVLIVSNSPQCPMATFDRRKIKLRNPCSLRWKSMFKWRRILDSNRQKPPKLLTLRHIASFRINWFEHQAKLSANMNKHFPLQSKALFLSTIVYSKQMCENLFGADISKYMTKEFDHLILISSILVPDLCNFKISSVL